MIAEMMINIKAITELYLVIIGIASIIIRATPTLKDDNFLKGVLKFTGRYISLNKTITPAEQKAVNKG